MIPVALDVVLFYAFAAVVILGIIPGALAAAPYVHAALCATRDAFVEAVRK